MDNFMGLICLTISVLLCSGILIYFFLMLSDIKYQLNCIEEKIEKYNNKRDWEDEIILNYK